MWTSARGEETIEARRRELLEKGFELFSTKTIETVSIYRYYSSKPEFVVAVATWKWEQFCEENKKRRPKADFTGVTAADIFAFYLDSFLQMYKNQRELLRFNQFFNVYVRWVWCISRRAALMRWKSLSFRGMQSLRVISQPGGRFSDRAEPSP